MWTASRFYLCIVDELDFVYSAQRFWEIWNDRYMDETTYTHKKGEIYA